MRSSTTSRGWPTITRTRAGSQKGSRSLGLPVDPWPETNIVMFGVADTMGFARAAHECGVLVIPLDPGRFRAVTHLDVSAGDVDEALARIATHARMRSPSCGPLLDASDDLWEGADAMTMQTRETCSSGGGALSIEAAAGFAA